MSDFTQITAQELVLRAERLFNQVKRIAGYDTCKLNSVEIRPDENVYRVWLHLDDDFSDELVGYKKFDFAPDVSDPKLPLDHPLREERELAFLAKAHGNSRDISKQMKTAEARAFATRIADGRDQIGLMLKDYREEREVAQ